MSVIEPNRILKNVEDAARDMPDELLQIADALPVTIARVDREERYRFNNLAYEKWFGLRPDQLYGRTVREMLGEKVYETVRPHLRAALNGE